MAYDGFCSRRTGKVMGSLPLGFVLPNKMSATALPSSLPRNHAWRTVDARFIQGISTGVPEKLAMIVRGLDFSTASASSFCRYGNLSNYRQSQN
jgi:hypothetical protein